jgi:hypothetical protein
MLPTCCEAKVRLVGAIPAAAACVEIGTVTLRFEDVPYATVTEVVPGATGVTSPVLVTVANFVFALV